MTTTKKTPKKNAPKAPSLQPDQAMVPAPTQALEAAQSQSEQMMSRILDIAADPKVDVDKLERLIELQRKANADQARRLFFDAMAEMQDELPVIKKDGAIEFVKNGRSVRTPFAKIEDILKPLAPILKKYGFSLGYSNRFLDGGLIEVTTSLRHRAGHVETSSFVGAPDGTGHKNQNQAIRSTLSYGRRSGVTDVLNIITEGEDDDGGKPHGEPKADDLDQPDDAGFDAWVDLMRQTAMQGTPKLMAAMNAQEQLSYRTRLVQLDGGSAWREMRKVAQEAS